MKLLLFVISTMLSIIGFCQSDSYEEVVNARLQEIRNGIEQKLFVRRFQSVETPCVYIDPSDHSKGKDHRDVINSDFRIQYQRNRTIDPEGVQCLSKYCAQYMKLSVNCVDVKNLQISGDVFLTYGYPAGNLIQHWGFASGNPFPEQSYFSDLLKSRGSFTLYPDKEKYRMKISLQTGPYDSRDSFYAHLEIADDQYGNPFYSFFFDGMSLFKGDRQTQISTRFSSTSYRQEGIYYSTLVFHTLKFLNDPVNSVEKAEAVWLKNFLTNTACTACQVIYRITLFRLFPVMELPNTNPVPPH